MFHILRTISFFLLITSVLCSCGSGPVEVKNDTLAATLLRKKSSDVKLTKEGIIVMKELERNRKTPFEDAIGRLNDSLLICSYKGKVSLADTLRKNARPLFDIKAEFMIDHIFVYRYTSSEYFVVWQETDHEGVKSYVALFNEHDVKPAWERMFPVPNPGIPVIDGDHAYVSTLGMVGKLQMKQGEFDWKLDSLFNQMNGAYKSFEPATVYDKKVLFVDFPIPGKRNKRDTLTLDPLTGVRLK